MGSGVLAIGWPPGKGRIGPLCRLPDPTRLEVSAAYVVCSVLGLGLESISLGQERRVMGRIKMPLVNLRGKGAEAVRPHLIVGFAGPWAESKVNPVFSSSNGGSSDEVLVGELAVAAPFGGSEANTESELTAEEELQATALLDEAKAASRQLVDEHWLASIRVADVLLTYATLSGVEVARIMALVDSQQRVQRASDPIGSIKS